MKNKNLGYLVFRVILYVSSAYFVLSAFRGLDILASRDADIIFMLMLVAAILISKMEISVGKGYVQLTDALVGFLFITFGRDMAVFFDACCVILSSLIAEKFFIHGKDKSKMFFNTSMFVTATYLASTLTSYVIDNINGNYLQNVIIGSGLFVGTFLIVNIFIVKNYYRLSTGNKFKFDYESKSLLVTNFVVSSMLITTLCLIYSASRVIGSILVIGNLIILHYCFYIYRKLRIRNNAVNGLLKITSDIVKYGDFRDKCKHLIINLKELIPYNICAVYTFDAGYDSIAYPIAYNGTEELGIGELSLLLSSDGVTVKTVMEGKIYICRDITRDKKIKITGKLSEVCDAMVFVPILIEDKVSGLILIGGNQDLSAFVNNGINDILNILSNQMSLAIENDNFYRRIKNNADRDPLTKLYNRNVFDREINSLINSKTQFSMVIYDIDDFKSVNDGYGHLNGDKVLSTVTDIISKSIRKTDIPCRYGGEEIAIIFKDLSKDDAYIISDRIRDKIEKTGVITSRGQISVTVSGGVATFPDDGQTKDDLIEKADGVLYSECKNKGKNRVCAYNLATGNNYFQKRVGSI